MKKEFERYGLSQFRSLVGGLELLGGLGLIIGLKVKILSILASGGLATLMFLGVMVRLKIKDRPKEILPAFTLMVVNLLIFYLSLTF